MLVRSVTAGRYHERANVEAKEQEYDIILILDGPRARGANELTGSGIRDGTARRVGKGDISPILRGR